VTEQLDGTVPGEAVPGIATSSYAADDRLLAELRAVWPPAVEPRDSERGYVATDLDGSAPAAALRLGDRFAVALLAEPDGGFRVVPVVRDEILVTSWRLARPGDGLSAFVAGVPAASERAIDGDQTNVSVVVGERAIVKWSRTVGPGPSRATVLLAHLDAVGFRELPTPLGSLAWQTPAGHDLTIAQGDAFLPGARDGWEWCVERLERHVAHDEGPCPAGCDPWIDARLGELIGRLHLALATPSAVIPYPAAVADAGTVAGWVEAAHRTLDEALELDEALALEALALDAVAAGPDRRRFLAAIEPAMRAELDGIALDRPISVQPVHGDLHVGQVLEWSGGLAVIDFDGNPALGDRGNALRQPLERDIAQMLSSVDHVGRVVDRRTAGRNRRVIDEWIERTRRQFLAALEIVPDPRLLAAFEVEQECRELVYAARFLPRWRYAPLATLRARYGT
jgi:maltokinase